MLRTAISCAVLLMAAPCLSAQESGASADMEAALAAGWKAGFICSATFNGGQSLSEIEANELDGIYPDFQEAYDELPAARIDRDAKLVSVSWSQTLPPRYAFWRQGYGCTQLPIGGQATLVGYLPRFTAWQPAPQTDASSAIGSDVTITQKTSYFQTLDAPVSFAFDGYTYGDDTRTSAVVVVADGQVIAERYGRGVDAVTPQRTWSVAKSISATIIGASSYQGLFDYKGRTAIAAWETPGDPRQSITTEHLLHMASGLDSGARGNRTDRLYFGGGRVTDHAATNPLETAPGRRWKYANNDTLLAMRALRERLGDDALYHRFPYEQVLWKIGAFRTTLETDWTGDFLSSSQVWTTARDLARLGQLYLQDGVWGGERLLPEGWADYVSTPAPVQPSNRSGFGYGAQFWLFDNVPGVPRTTYAALGNRGQHVVIIPERNVVIVRRGYDPNGGERFDIGQFTADILAAMDVAEEAKRAAEAAASEAENADR